MEATPPQAETHTDDFMHSTAIQAQLQERARQFADRQQQTGEAHQGLLSGRTTPIMDRLFSGLGGLSRTSSRAWTPMAQPTPLIPQAPDIHYRQ